MALANSSSTAMDEEVGIKMRHSLASWMGFAVLLIGLFLYGCGSPSVSESLAATSTAEPLIPTEVMNPTEVHTSEPLRAGDAAPDFTLPDSQGNFVRLADALQDNQLIVLVFYYSHL